LSEAVAALESFAAANGISLTNVPEPMGAGLVVMAEVGILKRRRRYSQPIRSEIAKEKVHPQV